MTKKNCIKPVAAAIGAAMVGTLSAVNVANAAENPFGASQLESGYMTLAANHETGEKEMKDGKCGEGKCGGDKKMKDGKCGEGKCGGDKKMKDGKCGGDKDMKDGKCGGDKEMKDGKCGEGKCGGDKKMKEGKCGGK